MHSLTIEDHRLFTPIKKDREPEQLGCTLDLSDALRSATRRIRCHNDSELRDVESIRCRYRSGNGHLSSVRLPRPPSQDRRSYHRLISVDEQSQILTSLADGIKAVLTQKLLPGLDKNGMV